MTARRSSHRLPRRMSSPVVFGRVIGDNFALRVLSMGES